MRDRLFGKGMGHFNEGRYSQALDQFNIGLTYHSDDAKLHTGRGAALAGLGDKEGGLASLNTAISLDGNCVLAYRYKSMILTAMGSHDEALIASNRADESYAQEQRAYQQRKREEEQKEWRDRLQVEQNRRNWDAQQERLREEEARNPRSSSSSSSSSRPRTSSEEAAERWVQEADKHGGPEGLMYREMKRKAGRGEDCRIM